ncbi:hypothetical protein WICMUC_002138 [Wickerhamomyces mucosus]|uniref:Dephospho-CoA kinase n=1 Tax=Wickerhamomyces mucosus TaxID=1378264 RepID=A0A9P8TEU4_9ASCO|nr:hypothetical protein WICMUC_002138 [Wickerhamomyces mucosus]
MLIVGLTGGIGSGKSTVSAVLKDKHHIKIIDADLIAKQVQEPGKPAYKKIVSYYQKKVPNLLLKDGKINSPELGKYVFANRDELKILNSIVHPAVRYEIFRQILVAYFTFHKLVILDVPLLFEAGLDKFCGATIVVVCEEQVQIERLLKRNSYLTLKDVKQRIDSQMSNHVKISKADYIIDNSTTFENLYEQINGMVSRINPNIFVYLLECIPPLGFLSAITTFIIKRVHDYNIRSKEE